MKLTDIINITENTVIVYAPAYNKDGKEYKGKTIELGRFGRYNRPPDSIRQATVISMVSYDTDHISVVIDV